MRVSLTHYGSDSLSISLWFVNQSSSHCPAQSLTPFLCRGLWANIFPISTLAPAGSLRLSLSLIHKPPTTNISHISSTTTSNLSHQPNLVTSSTFYLISHQNSTTNNEYSSSATTTTNISHEPHLITIINHKPFLMNYFHQTLPLRHKPQLPTFRLNQPDRDKVRPLQDSILAKSRARALRADQGLYSEIRGQ